MKQRISLVKRMIQLSLIILCSITIIGCSYSSEGLVISSKEVPFTNCEDDFGVDDLDAVKLYFVDEGAVPYIDVVTYIGLIDVMSQLDLSDVVAEENGLTIEYNPVIYQTMFLSTMIAHEKDSNYRQSMSIDFDEDTVTVSSYLFFMYQGAENIVETEPVRITDVSIEQGSPVTIPFNEYGFDFIVNEKGKDLEYLIPFHVASLLFNNSMKYKTYYNGDEIVGGGLCIYRDESVRTSSFNGLEIPEDVRLASYNLFTLALDYFSPMKQLREVESYREEYMNKVVTLTNANSRDYYYEFTKLLYKVDDLHADLPALGYYSSNPNDSLTTNHAWHLPIRAEYYNTIGQYSTAFKDIYEFISEPPTVRLLDNDRIAVIHLYQFTETMPDEFQSYLDELPNSVEHVVVDLSLNGGGRISSIFRLLGYMTDDPITFINGIAIDGTSRIFTVEVDQEAYDYDWYILTSKVTYSAANITTLLAKENDIATIIGEQSSGGASPVESILLPCGFSHTISGNYTFYSANGTSEYGVPVDIPMMNFWDDDELIDIVNQE